MHVTVGSVSVRTLADRGDGERSESVRTRVEAARELLAAASEQMALSARGYHRVLKVARTIADLDVDDTVRQPHIAEALRYRPAIAAAPPAA